MALGEIIDRAATVWRKQWAALFRLFLAFELAQYALLKGYQVLQARFFPLARGGARTFQALSDRPEEAFRQIGIAAASGGVTLIIFFYVSLIAGIAATRYLVPAFHGQTGVLKGALARARARLGTSLGVLALMLGWSLLVGLLFCIPGGALLIAGAVLRESKAALPLLVLGSLLVLLAMLAWVLWFILRVSLLSQVLAEEDVGVLQTFRRSDALTSGRIEPGVLGLVKVRLTLLITVLGLILFMVSLVSGAPALIINGVYGNIFDPTHANPDAVPQLLLVPAELFNVIVQSLIAPLYLSFQTAFYLDMRNRREGLDLLQQIEAER